MKIKNKLIKKIVINGLIGSLLLNSVPFYSFANNEINTINTNEAGNIKEISPQMIAVLSSLAIGSGITITTNDDIYDLSRMFYDYVKNNNELTWDFVQSTFLASCFLVNDVVHVDNNFLDIVKGFFDSTFSEDSDVKYSDIGIPVGYENAIKFDTSSTDSIDIQLGEVSITGKYVKSSNSFNYYDAVITYRGHVFADDSFGTGYTFTYYWYNPEYNEIRYYANNPPHDEGFHGSIGCLNGFLSPSVVNFPYNGGYIWDNVESKKENESIALPIPGNLDQLVGQGSDSFWDNTDGLINPCTQEIILPEIENPSINIGEPIKLQTDANCSIYNAEDLVTKAEESKNQDDINNARNEVNKLPEGQDKQDLQNRLDAIIPNVTLSTNSATANLDVYIKSENSLVMTLDSNSITFDGFSSVEDMVKENTVTVTIKSSLPYELNSYLVQEITSLDDEPKILDKEILNIKANGTDTYNTFEDIGTTSILLLDNQTPGEVNEHGIDFMLDADIPYENGNYKTVIKFEAKQK